jgi:hypothetical protein
MAPLPEQPLLQWGPVGFYPHFLYRFLYGDGVPAQPGEHFATDINVACQFNTKTSLEMGFDQLRCNLLRVDLAWSKPIPGGPLYIRQRPVERAVPETRDGGSLLPGKQEHLDSFHLPDLEHPGRFRPCLSLLNDSEP